MHRSDGALLEPRALLRRTIVYGVFDALSPDFPLADALEVFVRREDAERFIAEVRGDDPQVTGKLRIEKRELLDTTTRLAICAVLSAFALSKSDAKPCQRRADNDRTEKR